MYINFAVPRVTKPSRKYTTREDSGTVYTMSRVPFGRDWECRTGHGTIQCPTLRELRYAVRDYDSGVTA